MSRLWSLILALLVLSVPVVATTPNNDLSIEGDQVDYDHRLTYIFATGNVVMNYQDSTLNATRFRYSLADKKLLIPGPFKLSRDGQIIEGSDLNYDLTSRTGNAKTIRANMGPWHISGEDFESFGDHFIVKNAQITTCESWDHPHYYIHSKRIALYPESGIISAADNEFYHHLLPAKIWIPTYTHNAAQGQGSSPFPVFGTSVRESNYIKEYFSYFWNARQSGNFHLGYSGRLGLLAGVSHHTTLQAGENLSTSLMTYGSDGLGGGIRYHKGDFGTPSENSSATGSAKLSFMNDLFSPLAKFGAEEKSSYTLSWLYGELVGDYRVDRRPDLEIVLPRSEFFNTGIRTSRTFHIGYLGEKNLGYGYTQSFRADSISELRRDFDVVPDLSLWTSLTNDMRFYEHGARWTRQFGQLGVSTRYFLNPSLWFTHVFRNSGISPFESERQFSVQHDELGLRLFQELGPFTTLLDGRYDLVTRQIVLADYQMTVLFHCWTVIFNWRINNGNINVGVGLDI